MTDKKTETAEKAVEPKQAVNEKKEAQADLFGDSKKYELTLENLLKAGVHFGHKKSRWNPKMQPYIFGIKSGIHIIDIEKTLEMFKAALDFMKSVVENNEEVLIVGTKKQVKDLVREVAEKAELPYVSERWIGGTFTNFENISRRIRYLIDTQKNLEAGRLSHLTKLEKNKLQKELDKIEAKMGGLKRMKRIPKAIFVLDIQKDVLAVKEAKEKGVTVVGLIDTNSDPAAVDFPIPANDDAYSSLNYILGVFLNSVAKTEDNQIKEKDDKKTKKD